jgi:hypothetical protein
VLVIILKLKVIERNLIQAGEDYRFLNKINDQYCLLIDNSKLSDNKINKLTENDMKILKYGDIGQGEALNKIKSVFKINK